MQNYVDDIRKRVIFWRNYFTENILENINQIINTVSSIYLITYSGRNPTKTNNSNVYQEINWNRISGDNSENICKPPILPEIKLKLSKVFNTSPGQDKIENIHLRRSDRNRGVILHVIFVKYI